MIKINKNEKSYGKIFKNEKINIFLDFFRHWKNEKKLEK